MKSYKDRLAGLLFLEFIPEKAEEIFRTKVEKDLYIPMNPEFLVKKVTAGDDLTNIPITEFITGMAFSLGADPDLRFNDTYIRILRNFKDGENIVKAKIASLMKENRKEEAFILLMGLTRSLEKEDIENVMLSVGEEIALKDKDLKDNMLALTETAIERGNKNGHLIRGSLFASLGRDKEALVDFHEYLRLGGENTKELTLIMDELDRKGKLQEAYALVHEKPEKALEILLPFYRLEADNPTILFNIAVAYRELGNNEKAIYYLNEAYSLDAEYLDVLNELGINYGMMEDFESAKPYFRKVYETTKDIAPLTNLIIAEYSTGNREEAEYLLTKAKALSPDDEIIEAIEKAYGVQQ